MEEAKGRLREFKRKPTQQTVLNWNAFVRGLHNYFKGMTNFYKSFNKIQWRIYKLFRHVMSRTAKTYQANASYDKQMRKQLDDWGYKSWGQNKFHHLHGFPVLQLDWANWDNKLCGYLKQKVKRTNPYDYGKSQQTGVSGQEIQFLVHSSQMMINGSMKYRDFRVSKYSCCKGRSYISGQKVSVGEYHCHHMIPKTKGGTDNWDNLCVLSESEHRLLHSNNYMTLLDDVTSQKFKKRIKELISKVHGITIK